MEHNELIAWAAGFIDGEGAIGFAGQTHGPARNRHAGHMKLQIVCWQTSMAPLERLRDLFGGSIYTGKAQTERHRKIWFWRIQGWNAYETLLTIEPFLANKRDQIEVAHEFMTGVRRHSWGGPVGMPQEEIDRRAALHERMKLLNQRGPRR